MTKTRPSALDMSDHPVQLVKGGKEDEEVEGVGGDGREDGDEESCAVRMWS